MDVGGRRLRATVSQAAIVEPSLKQPDTGPSAGGIRSFLPEIVRHIYSVTRVGRATFSLTPSLRLALGLELSLRVVFVHASQTSLRYEVVNLQPAI